MDVRTMSDEDAVKLCRSYLDLDDDSPVKPRPYQCKAFIASVLAIEDEEKSGLLAMATGTGKTVTFLLVAKYVIEKLGGRVLILAHRGELITQAANAAAFIGLTPAIEKADEHARPDLTKGESKSPSIHSLFSTEDEIDFGGDDGDPKLVIASVQTMQRDRLKAWPPGHFALVITDECHHSSASSYVSIIDHLTPKYHLGVTATWERGDKELICGRRRPFERKLFEYDILHGVEEGYLARPVVEVLDCGVDLSKIRTTGGDYNLGDLEAAIKPHVQTLVNLAAPYLKDKTFIGFAPDVGSGEAIASAFESIGISCKSIAGHYADRDELVRDFRDRRFNGFINCQLFTEGADFPFVDAIPLFRPTQSWGLFMQMIGRGSRLFEGKKECRIIAFNWKTVGHDFIKPIQIFTGSDDLTEIEKEAEGLVKSGECKDLLLALKRAKEEHSLRQKLRIKVEKENRSIRSVRYDPLAIGDDYVPPEHKEERKIIMPATENQMGALIRAGFEPNVVAEFSKARASGILTALARRREQGLASHKQLKYLKQTGHPDPMKATFEEASAFLDAKFGNRRTA